MTTSFLVGFGSSGTCRWFLICSGRSTSAGDSSSTPRISQLPVRLRQGFLDEVRWDHRLHLGDRITCRSETCAEQKSTQTHIHTYTRTHRSPSTHPRTSAPQRPCLPLCFVALATEAKRIDPQHLTGFASGPPPCY
jgi:hypothetical protein